MGYNLTVKDGNKYILIELHSKLTQVDIDEALKEIHIIRRRQGVNCILCDQRRLQTPPNDIIVFETARRFAGEPFTGMKLAIVRENIPERHFFETAATNRSGIVKIFDEEAKAKEWLQNGDL